MIIERFAQRNVALHSTRKVEMENMSSKFGFFFIIVGVELNAIRSSS